MEPYLTIHCFEKALLHTEAEGGLLDFWKWSAIWGRRNSLEREISRSQKCYLWFEIEGR